jgi:hypothetical protein
MKKIVLSFFFFVFGLLLLPQIIGLVVDCIAYPFMKKEAGNAQQYFAEVNVDDTSNAWYYYFRAGEKFDDNAWNREVYQYIDGTTEITPNILTAIRGNKQALELLQDGTKRNFCKIPHDQERLMSSSLSMSYNLFKLVDLIDARALLNLKKMDYEDAIADIFSIISVSEHVASDGAAIDYMMGCKFIYQSCRLLEMGLESGSFNEIQLGIIADRLMALETEWPKFARVLEIEAKTTLIMLSNPRREGSGGVFMSKMLLRYIHWKYLFSYNFAYLGGYRFMNELSDELEEKEEIDSLIYSFNENLNQDVQRRIRIYGWKNFIYGIELANIVHLYERRLHILTNIRILHLCSEAQRYKLEHGYYPPKIEEFEKRVYTDFNTGECFNYTNFGDSIIVSSPGPDLDSEKDDVSLTLTDIGIKKYLERKRNAVKKPEE